MTAATASLHLPTLSRFIIDARHNRRGSDASPSPNKVTVYFLASLVRIHGHEGPIQVPRGRISLKEAAKSGKAATGYVDYVVVLLGLHPAEMLTSGRRA